MFARIWSRTKETFARWFRREPAPGRFESGSRFSWRGWLTTAPFVWPSRDYLVYVPKGRPLFKRAPLLVWCHGCKQTPEEFAQGTRIAALADRVGCVVLLPRQKRTANPWSCWNWFERRTMAGMGEAAIVAAQIRRVRRHYRIDHGRVLAAGISAGGALAAVLGVRYPKLVGAVAVHSGLACGAASSALTALSIMARGPDQNVEAIGAEARLAAAPHDVRVPLLAIHGAGDEIVAPRNAVALVRQFLRLNGHPAAAGGDATIPPVADVERTDALADGRRVVVREWRRDGRLVARHVEVVGLGHAWSGGDASLKFNDPAPPDATALVVDFFADALS